MTNYGLTKLKNEFKKFLDHGTYTVDGQTKNVDIRKIELKNTKIRVFLYLQDDQGVGELSRYQLIDDEGNVFDEKSINKTKTDVEGLLIGFEYDMQEV